MKNKFLKIFYLFFLITTTINITIASETDNYYKNLLKKNNIHYSIYNNELNLDDLPKNIITSQEEVIEIVLENKFDNLIYICNHELDVNDCISLFETNTSLIGDLIEPIILYNEVEIYKYSNLNRNIYIVPEYVLMSTIYSDYLYDYLGNYSSSIQKKSFDINFYSSIIFETFIYLVTLFIIYNFIYIFIYKQNYILSVIKSNQYVLKKLSKISSLLLLLMLLVQPFIIIIYKALYNKSLDIKTLKSFYVLNIVSPRLYTSMDLVIYFMQVVNVLLILLLILVLIMPFIIKYLSNSKNKKKNIFLIIFTFFLLIFFGYTSPKTDINLLNEKNYLNKNYVINENALVNEIDISQINNLFIDTYLIFNNKFSLVKNTNLENLNTLTNSFYIIANDLNEYIKTSFYLNKTHPQVFNNLITSNSNINFYSNLSFNPNNKYFIDVNIICNYKTQPFTFSIFIYSQDQFKSNIEPEKLDFYNFSGCNAGEYINIKLPIRKFNLYEQDSIFVLRSREQESDPNIDTNGIEYNFELMRDNEILKKTSINYYNSKIIYRNLIQNTEKQLNVYSIRSNDFEVKHDDFSISNTINIMKNSGLINNTFYLWGN